jgi:hypothetical protein
MTAPAPAQPAYYRPADVAALLRCSAWWVKEQARRGRIPYSWIGGGYLFTDEHVAEIVRLFERRPAQPPAVTAPLPRHQTAAVADVADATVVQLRARPPRRTRHGDGAAA